MSQDKVLVVDDEPTVVELITTYLQESGYEVMAASSGTKGLSAFFLYHPDLVLLDIIMPGMDGLQVCQRIREISTVPIIFLSAKGTEEAKVRGLKLGADDYICKPVGMKELLARVEAAIRRARIVPSKEPTTMYRDDIVTIHMAAHRVFLRGKEMAFSPLEYSLFLYLVQNAGCVVTTDQILDRVWGENYYSPDSVKWYISQIRKKVEEDPAKPQLIITVRGLGYRYEKPVTQLPPSEQGET